MRQVSSVAAIAVLAACGHAQANGYTNHSSSTGFNLPGVTTPSGYDEVRAADGTTCRSALGNRGAYVDVGGVASQNDGAFGNGAVYGRLIVPLGQKPDRIDCGNLYQLEIDRLRMEVALMKASQGASSDRGTPISTAGGGFSDKFEDGPDGGSFEDGAAEVTGRDEPVNRRPAGFAEAGTPPRTMPAGTPLRDIPTTDADPWSDEVPVETGAVTGRPSPGAGRDPFQWDAAEPLPFAGPIPTMRPVMLARDTMRDEARSASEAARRLAGAPDSASPYVTAYAGASADMTVDTAAHGTGGAYLPIDPMVTGSIPTGFDRAMPANASQRMSPDIVSGEIVANWALNRSDHGGDGTLAVLADVYGASLAVPFDDFDALIMTDMGESIPMAVPFGEGTRGWLDGAFAD